MEGIGDGLTVVKKTESYSDVYGEAYNRQIRQLEQSILQKESGEKQFEVINFESGIGKSVEAAKIIRQHLADFTNPIRRNFLVVKKFRRDVDEFAFKQSDVDNFKILGITAENWKAWNWRTEELKRFRVLVITHKRYMDLCLSESFRSAFCANRHTLIIDEKLTFPSYTFTDLLYNDVRTHVGRKLEKMFDDVCAPLRDKLEEYHKNKCTQFSFEEKPAMLEQLQTELQKVFKQLAKKKGVIINEDEAMTDKTLNRIEILKDGLPLWFSGKCVYNGGRISTINPKHIFWTLHNNIILDASAGIDGIYEVSKGFQLYGQERIISHKASKLYGISFNSSQSNIYGNAGYYSVVCNAIIKHHALSDRTLVVCHKKHHEEVVNAMKSLTTELVGIGNDISDEDMIAINWFGNLIGRNEYRDFTQVWIVGTPNLPSNDYLMQYLHYTGNKGFGRKSLEMVKGSRFVNPDLKKLQEGYIHAEIYQSLKRIQRSPKPAAEFFVISHDKKLFKTIKKELKGIRSYDLDIGLHALKGLKPQKQYNVDHLKAFLLGLTKGKYAKAWIEDETGMTNMDRYWDHPKIIALHNEGEIRIYRNEIVVL